MKSFEYVLKASAGEHDVMIKKKYRFYYGFKFLKNVANGFCQNLKREWSKNILISALSGPDFSEKHKAQALTPGNSGVKNQLSSLKNALIKL